MTHCWPQPRSTTNKLLAVYFRPKSLTACTYLELHQIVIPGRVKDQNFVIHYRLMCHLTCRNPIIQEGRQSCCAEGKQSRKAGSRRQNRLRGWFFSLFSRLPFYLKISRSSTIPTDFIRTKIAFADSTHKSHGLESKSPGSGTEANTNIERRVPG